MRARSDWFLSDSSGLVKVRVRWVIITSRGAKVLSYSLKLEPSADLFGHWALHVANIYSKLVEGGGWKYFRKFVFVCFTL